MQDAIVSTVRVVLPWANLALLLCALAGLACCRRVRALRLLPVYLAVGVLTRIPLLLWRERFYTWGYWLATELACALLALAIAYELVTVVFGRLPAARQRAALLAAAVLAVACAALLVQPVEPGASADSIYYQGSLHAAQAKLAAGIVCGLLLATALHYAVPLEPLQRDVAAGFALWALLQAFGEQLAVLDPFLGVGRQGLQRLIYTGVLSAWAWAAWRPSPATALSPAALRLLQPWRAAA